MSHSTTLDLNTFTITKNSYNDNFTLSCSLCESDTVAIMNYQDLCQFYSDKEILNIIEKKEITVNIENNKLLTYFSLHSLTAEEFIEKNEYYLNTLE